MFMPKGESNVQLTNGFDSRNMMFETTNRTVFESKDGYGQYFSQKTNDIYYAYTSQPSMRVFPSTMAYNYISQCNVGANFHRNLGLTGQIGEYAPKHLYRTRLAACGHPISSQGVTILRMAVWIVRRPTFRFDTVLTGAEKSWLSTQLGGTELSSPEVCYTRPEASYSKSLNGNKYKDLMNACFGLADKGRTTDYQVLTMIMLENGKKIVVKASRDIKASYSHYQK